MPAKGLTGRDRRRRARPQLPKERVLFFCACNSIRSQMAEGLLRAFYGDRYEVSSAGLRPAATVDPLAVRVMAELGIDISGSSTKGLEALVGVKFDCIAFVCGDPKGPCPFTPQDEEFVCKGCFTCCAFYPLFPLGRRTLHAQFQNPVDLGDSDNHMEVFRQLRDDIAAWIEKAFPKRKPSRSTGRQKHVSG
jgi:arsenate reductase (thioredoxin)